MGDEEAIDASARAEAAGRATAPDDGRGPSLPSARRLVMAIGAAAAVAAIALVIAARMDEPVGEGAVDTAQPIVAGPIVAPGSELTGEPEEQTQTQAQQAESVGDLPPLALVLDRLPPDGIGSLAAEDQIPRLRALAATRAEPRRLVELGAAYQATGRYDDAREAFVNALRLDQEDVAAEVGLALNDALADEQRSSRAAAALAALAARNPDNQIIAFNRGWLAAYRRDVETAESAWRKTIALDSDSRLGQTARELLRLLVGDAQDGGRGTETQP